MLQTDGNESPGEGDDILNCLYFRFILSNLA